VFFCMAKKPNKDCMIAEMTMVEAVARKLCQLKGYDPDDLEPGSTPYGTEEEIIDGEVKGGPAFFMWRQYVSDAQQILSVVNEYVKAC